MDNIETFVVCPINTHLCYGPFMNIDLAHLWASDHPELCPLGSTRILTVTHPDIPEMFIARVSET